MISDGGSAIENFFHHFLLSRVSRFSDTEPGKMDCRWRGRRLESSLFCGMRDCQHQRREITGSGSIDGAVALASSFLKLVPQNLKTVLTSTVCSYIFNYDKKLYFLTNRYFLVDFQTN